MIPCLICDDDLTVSNEVNLLINEYNRMNSVSIKCDIFSDPLKAKAAILNGTSYQLYILDIVMPELTGIELAKEIRKRDSDSIIFFLTSSNEFHSDAFAVEALQYLTKPVSKHDLFRILDRSNKLIQKQVSKRLPIQAKGGIYSFPVHEIIYVESHRHVLTFTIKDGQKIDSLSGSISLEKVMETLDSPIFYSPYKGYIINFNHVSCLEPSCFIMIDHASIPISKKQYSKVRKDYSEYILSQCKNGGNL